MTDFAPTEITRLFELQLYLNTALMQSPSTISKTQKSIDYIRHFAVLSRFNQQSESGTHHITLVLTNNNLSETRQWNVRLKKKLSTLNTIILSSSEESDIKNYQQLDTKLLRLKSASDIPDLIVMCTHEKRVSDVLQIIQLFKSGRLNLRDIGIHKISLTIMFDEADKNMSLIAGLLKGLWPLLRMPDLRRDDVLRDIHFITATPLDEFWKALKKCGISKLKNINQAIMSMDETSVLHTKYSELMEQYFWLKRHARSHAVTDMSTDSVDYARKVLRGWSPLEAAAPRIVFAPADIQKHTHNDMRDLFLEKGYWVYVDNSDRKGFYNPSNGAFKTKDDFCREYSTTGEPYEMFKKWKEIHPTAALAITGWLTIMRGITFNTTGFNFTDVILSAAHARNLADLLQVAGRANGDAAYVKCATIHTPTIVWDALDERIELMKELHEKNVDEFEERDFRPKSKREEQEVAWTVPRVFEIGAEKYAAIKKVGTSKIWDVKTIFAQIDDAALVADLQRRKDAKGQFQITQPEAPNTYKKYITDFVQKAVEKRLFNMGLHEDDKQKDGFQIFLDNKEHRLIVSLYNGANLEAKTATTAPTMTAIEHC